MPRTIATKAGGVLACALSFVLLWPATAPAGVDDLQAKVAAARSQAGSLASELQAAQGELAVAQQEAAAASAREQQLSTLLASGEERAAELATDVAGTERRLARERRRLRRARQVLAERLVAIYESGSPSTASVILGSSDFDELATRADYLQRIEESDTELAERVAQVRAAVARGLKLVEALKDKVDAYNARLADARSQISAVRENAEATAVHLQSVASARAASLSTLKNKIGSWVSDIEAAQAAAAERVSDEAAEATVERWLGGPYSIPTEIVMCESGGNYSAVNPSSGAGGAYQILPSTWDLYGGQGNPEDAPKSEQDAIAAEIWADSGSSAWVCAG